MPCGILKIYHDVQIIYLKEILEQRIKSAKENLNDKLIAPWFFRPQIRVFHLGSDIKVCKILTTGIKCVFSFISPSLKENQTYRFFLFFEQKLFWFFRSSWWSAILETNWKVVSINHEGTTLIGEPADCETKFTVRCAKYDTLYYYSTIASFYHIWSRERAKYETVIHCSVPVWPV